MKRSNVSALTTSMLKSYFKTGWRDIKRNKMYTLINVLGLGLGIACVILIFSFVNYHLSFDTFHSNADKIYRVNTGIHDENEVLSPGVPPPFTKAFRNDFSFADKVAEVVSLENRIVSAPSSEKQEKFEENIAFAEPDFFEIFNFPLLRGNAQSVLKEPNTAVITERMAKKYFGRQDAIGKTIRIVNSMDFTITGILQDLPANTDRLEEIYLSFDNLKQYLPWMVADEWQALSNVMQCFIVLKPGVSQATAEKAFPAFAGKYYEGEDAKKYDFTLQPLSDIHFNSSLDGVIGKRSLWVLSLISIFLIVTACVNFVNLATAQALGRSKEIGIRKVMGSRPRQIFWQFIIKTSLIVMMALIVALILVYLALPTINQFFDTQLRINFFKDIYLLAFLPFLLLAVIFISGSYPGLVMAGFQPVLALKGKLSQKHIGGFSLRRSLVVIQFSISLVLLIGMIVITNQMSYSRQEDQLGFQKDAVVMLPVPGSQKGSINTLGIRLSQIPGIEKVTFCNETPIKSLNYFNKQGRFFSRPEKEDFSVSFKAGDAMYASTFGLEILEGRDLQPSDTVREFLVNETLVKKLGIASNKDIIGKNADIYGNGIIVGVVKDFHNQSFHEAIDPLCITTASDRYAMCAVKVSHADLVSVLQNVEKVWKDTFPEHVYKYNFLDEQVARFYQQEYVLLGLIQIFTGITIVIGCLGLFGLVSFMAAQKTKEVGVRKVLGASMQNISWLFGKEFIRLLLLAFVIASPLAWWAMTRWLEDFEYHVNIQWWVFALAGALTLFIVLLAVSFQVAKAAMVNPVKSLRSE